MYLTKTNPDKSYFYFSARVFELLIGACVFVFCTTPLRLGKLALTAIGIFSLAVICYCATRSDILQGFPNYYALYVCLATAVLLHQAVGEASLTSKLLSFRPLVFIGTISYSLYLWHWPILSIFSYLGVSLTPLLTVAYFAATFLLSYLSYVHIEKKFRKTNISFVKTLVFLLIIPAVSMSMLYSSSKKNSGWPERFDAGSTGVLTRLKHAEAPNRRYCLDGVSDGSDPRCIMGAPQSEDKAIMIGDSFSNQQWGFIDTLAKDANISVTAQAFPACLTLPDVYLYNWWKYKDRLYTECHDASKQYYDLIKKNNYKYVILGLIWESYIGDAVVMDLSDTRSVELSRQRLGMALRESLKMIKLAGATPVFLKAPLSMPVGVNECLYRAIKSRGLLGNSEDLKKCSSTDWTPYEDAWLSKTFSDLKVEFPNLIIIDPKTVQCSDTSCATALDGGVPVYRDIGHITDYASYKFGELYLHRFGNPFKNVISPAPPNKVKN